MLNYFINVNVLYGWHTKMRLPEGKGWELNLPVLQFLYYARSEETLVEGGGGEGSRWAWLILLIFREPFRIFKIIRTQSSHLSKKFNLEQMKPFPARRKIIYFLHLLVCFLSDMSGRSSGPRCPKYSVKAQVDCHFQDRSFKVWFTHLLALL